MPGRWPERWVLALSAGLATAGAPNVVRAAELRWDGPADCARAPMVALRVEDLTKRPLEAVEHLDFAVMVVRDGAAWSLTLVTRTSDREPSRRVFTGATCDEVSNAAAVAVAMAIQAEERQAASETSEPVAAPPAPAPAATATATSVRKADPAAPPVEKRTSPRLGGVVGLSAVLDTAALPHPTFGASAGGGVRWGLLRAEAGVAFFAPSRATLANGRSGEFSLWAAELAGCVEPTGAIVAVFGCAGIELGQLSGEGHGVSDPELGSVLWSAGRLEAGTGVGLGAGLRLVPRMGVAVPFRRPQFVLASEPVHRPGPLSLRVALGAEFLW